MLGAEAAAFKSTVLNLPVPFNLLGTHSRTGEKTLRIRVTFWFKYVHRLGFCEAVSARCIAEIDNVNRNMIPWYQV